MPTQHNRKPTRKHPHRKPLKARRTAAGRFTGKPAKGETLSETVMPDEYAPGAEPPREQPWVPDPVVVTALAWPVRSCYSEGGAGGDGEVRQLESAMNVEMSDADIKRAIADAYGIAPPRPSWYRRLWRAVMDWLR